MATAKNLYTNNKYILRKWAALPNAPTQFKEKTPPTVIHNTALDVTIEDIDPINERWPETEAK